MTQRAASQTGNTAHAGRARALDHVQSLSARVFGPTRLDIGDATGDAEDDAPDVQLRTCQIGHLTLATTRYGRAMEIEPRVGKDEFVIQTVTAGRCRLLAGGRAAEMPVGAVRVFSPSLPVRLQPDADCERFSVVIRRQALEAAFLECFSFDAPAPLVFDFHAADSARWQAMMAWLRTEFDARAQGAALATEAITDAAIERLVLGTLLVDQFGHDGSLLPRGFRAALPAYVRCAIRYLRAHLDKPVTLGALAAHCGVCERTLQLGFRKAKNTTPMEYLRVLRLQAARADLQRATPGRGAVSAIALRHGFTHLSLFSREYQREFGELPSATLRR
ncbi:HTH-type transcriptional activator RhaS [Cupriavidus campinensis]|uniref:AraC family transcriptional regulator n=1 Tax=Cupriavidus campinensis TaxID=151783 RepID=A0AAE9I428_9BURK|nr:MULTISPECIES: AraC family transcriptional regulator [Cupriavidus]TSP10445.1 AraC family transcriptional regulator [Cupriavidus campinensis]URF07037.1 AraC family transcriptional regulator [Cupriavidus campinensis]CAG2131168.1 HTH-type transcriptional activator RhaS [Cupriavidus campinensis]